MREIKFRALYTDYKKRKRWAYATLEQLIEAASDETDDNVNEFIIAVNQGSQKDQYTGLKDRNGREIFEGDIVKVHDSMLGDAENYPVVVCFGERDFEDEHYIGFYFSSDGEKNDSLLSWAFWEELEVIGNIYEHPNLVEK